LSQGLSAKPGAVWARLAPLASWLTRRTFLFVNETAMLRKGTPPDYCGMWMGDCRAGGGVLRSMALAARLYFPRVERVVEAGGRLSRILFDGLGIEDRVSRRVVAC
jgi:hypothetical protein